MGDARPRVCFVAGEYPPQMGGLARSARRVVRMVAAAGFDVHVVVAVDGAGAGLPAPACEDGATVYRLPMDLKAASVAGYGFRVSQALIELDRALGFDLFHGFFLTTGYPCLVARGARRRPLIASIRGSDVMAYLDEPLLRAPALRVLQEADWITSVNEAHLARAAAWVDVSGRSSVIRNAVDAAAFPAWALTEANRGVVGSVAQFRRVKNAPLLVEAYARVPAHLRRRLRLVGPFPDPAEAARLDDTIRRTGAPGVERDGPVPPGDVPALLAGLHVFVMCSDHEGLPNAVLEAAAAGVPIVATAVGGMAEVLADGRDALLVPPADPARLAAALTRVLADPDLAARLSAGARATAARLRPADEQRAWADLYRRLIAAAAVRAA